MDKKIFNLSFDEYLKKYLKYFIIIGIGILTLIVITHFVSTSCSIKTFKLLKFLKFMKYVLFIYVSFLISKNLYKEFPKYKLLIFGQGIIVGIGCGIITSIMMSIYYFILAMLVGSSSDAIFGFFSFIIEYTIITDSLLFIIFITIVSGIYWIRDNYKPENN